MIAGTDLVSLETQVRDLINEDTAKFWTQANIFRAINNEHKRLCRKVIELDNGWMEQITTTTPADTVALPINCYIVRNVELYIDSAWIQPTFIKDHQRGQHQAFGSTYPSAVMLYNGNLVFESGVSNASSLRIKYARLPSDLLYATLSSGSATTMVLPAGTGSVFNDAYNDDQFLVLDGTGVGEALTASDYVASTKTITVAATATLDNTTVISTLLHEPLAAWGDLVAMGAALRLLPRNRDESRSAMLRAEYERDYADMESTLKQRQSEQAEHGNYIPQGDD